MTYTTPIYFRPTPEQDEMLREQAQKESRKISDHLRVIVELGLKSYAAQTPHAPRKAKRRTSQATASAHNI